jgi:hypothetical protein
MKDGRKCRNCPYAVYRRWCPITSECAFGGVITNSKDELYGYRPEWCEYDISSMLRRAKCWMYAKWFNIAYKVENWYKSKREGNDG